MNNRIEPTKEQNEAAIRALKREGREKPPFLFIDATAGMDPHPWPGSYVVKATGEDMQRVTIATFPFDPFSGDRRETARILAEELADRINEQ